mmetsp:Transcript_3780/g.7802  ORF Transcript_3780/g.7802 Transcript_3780/m.7802 type:complete len:178 (+) Transcript_3780:310-843(+)|eukprot:CAMPEP_0118937894 /NCGR_PEP_ID=MMETSP1169-20130426/24081_1 /TAXON_ID=36882 /ORGANISM="Pyramimonas obovata, Strain CCMP722" /LENGTH=177 /DNA_ID=CAMNT_0006881657 /DNA_START=259 /DNA_END=792 /DNA_ORIENTATION=+
MSRAPGTDVLVLGLEGAGKSLLVRRLMSLAKTDNPTVPLDWDVVATVGVELQTVLSKRGSAITCREVGGAMLPVWTQYLHDCKVLLYVIDVSNPVVLASAAMELFVLLTSATIKDRHILVVLNKTDLPDVLKRTEVEMSLQLSKMPPHIKARLSVLETSVVEGTNTPEVLKWIRSHI